MQKEEDGLGYGPLMAAVVPSQLALPCYVKNTHLNPLPATVHTLMASCMHNNQRLISTIPPPLGLKALYPPNGAVKHV